MLTLTEYSGLVSRFEYDVLYRQIATYISTTPNGPANLWRTKVDFNPGGIVGGLSQNYIRTRINDAVDPVNGHETYTYSDGFGRKIQTRIESETAGQYRVSDIQYDARSTVKLRTLAYFSAGSAYTPLNPQQPGKTFEFDAIGRVVRDTPPQGDVDSPTGDLITSYRYNNDPWVTVQTDPEGKVKRMYHDARGNVVRITEVTSSGDHDTHYTYDLLNHLVGVTDAANNITTLTYDSLGQKTSMVDPDMGNWSYSYDAIGRIIEQTDAKGQKIKSFYVDSQQAQEPLGRLLRKEIYDNSQALVETVTIEYDTSDDPAYTVYPGQVYRITDGQGSSKNSYDARSRTVKSTQHLNINNTDYTVQLTYDDADRPSQLIYPNSVATLAYTYDTGGHLSRIESTDGTGTNEVFYVPGVFNELGQLTGVNFGNGLTTTLDYYTNSKRMKSLRTSAPGTGFHQDLAYTYDKTNNVKSITDATYTSGTASSTITNIQYDDLHRVTSLDATAQGVKTYSYDKLGNVVTNTEAGSGNYQYSVTQPHAVASANGTSYAYDANGNMTTRGTQALTYDPRNRLTQVVDGSTTVTYGYNEFDERLWKQVGSDLTVWVGGGIYEEKNGKVLCHVLADERRIATFEPYGTIAGLIEQTPVFAGTRDLLMWPLRAGRAGYSLLVATLSLCLVMCLRPLLARPIQQHAHRHDETLDAEVTWRRRPHFYLRSPWRQFITGFTACAMLFIALPQEAVATAGVPDYGPVFYYYHGDHLGSSSILTDREGDLVQHYGYTAFGKERYKNNTQAFSVSNRYTDQIFDEETGLYYYGARYYDPALARFIQPDTIVPAPNDPQSLNRYSYVNNNPLKRTDPTGHSFFSDLFDDIGAAFQSVIDFVRHDVVEFFKDEILQPLIAFTIGFVLSGGNVIVGLAAASATAVLDTGVGRSLIKSTAKEVFDDVFGLKPRAAFIVSSIVVHMVVAAAFEYTYASLVTKPAAEIKPFDPNNPTASEANLIANPTGYDSGGAELFDPSGNLNPLFNPASKLGKGSKVVTLFNAQGDALAIVGQKIVDGNPFGLNTIHTAAIFRSASAQGIIPSGMLGGLSCACHTTTNAALLKVGLSDTVGSITGNWSTTVTDIVYGPYGGQAGILAGYNADRTRE